MLVYAVRDTIACGAHSDMRCPKKARFLLLLRREKRSPFEMPSLRSMERSNFENPEVANVRKPDK